MRSYLAVLLSLFATLGVLGAQFSGAQVDRAEAEGTEAKGADVAEQSVNAGYSGMALLSDAPQQAEYLVVHDRKDKPSHEKYAWVGVVTWRAGKGTSWRPLPLVPPPGQDPANDLEACCRVPGLGLRFLLAESGYYQPPGGPIKYGRVILVSLVPSKTEPAHWIVRWEKSFQPFAPPLDLQDKSLAIEGMACLPLGQDRLALLLCTMGTRTGPSLLTWGALDLGATKPFARRGQARLTPGSGPLGARSCGDLFLKASAAGAGYDLWSAADVDPGDDGPFRSQVYWAGTLQPVAGEGLFRYDMRSTPEVFWTLDGLKVEALAPPPIGIPGAGLAFASDDEDHVGIWRVLPALRGKALSK